MAAVVDENDDESEVMETPVVWGRQDISSLKGNNLYWATVIEDRLAARKTRVQSNAYFAVSPLPAALFRSART